MTDFITANLYLMPDLLVSTQLVEIKTEYAGVFTLKAYETPWEPGVRYRPAIDEGTGFLLCADDGLCSLTTHIIAYEDGGVDECEHKDYNMTVVRAAPSWFHKGPGLRKVYKVRRSSV